MAASSAITVAFRALPQFNDVERQRLARVRARLTEHADWLFPTEGFADRLARAVAASRSVSLKELLESFEFYARVRRRMLAPNMADLCCGHGLTGILFAAFERRVKRVVLLDRREPDCAARLLCAVSEVAPWTAGKIERLNASLPCCPDLLPTNASVLAVHACGARTDRCIDTAIALASPIAVMPCCYRHTARMAPRALWRALGAELATDVHRTYRLTEAGYEVGWSAIPVAISPKNRILVAIKSRAPRVGRE